MPLQEARAGEPLCTDLAAHSPVRASRAGPEKQMSLVPLSLAPQLLFNVAAALYQPMTRGKAVQAGHLGPEKGRKADVALSGNTAGNVIVPALHK